MLEAVTMLTVEPMLCTGGAAVAFPVRFPDGWTTVTTHGGLSAQFFWCLSPEGSAVLTLRPCEVPLPPCGS